MSERTVKILGLLLTYLGLSGEVKFAWIAHSSIHAGRILWSRRQVEVGNHCNSDLRKKLTSFPSILAVGNIELHE